MDKRKAKRARVSPRTVKWSLGGVTVLLLLACVVVNHWSVPMMSPIYAEYAWEPDCSEGAAPACPFDPEELEFLRKTLEAVNRGDAKWLAEHYRRPEYEDTWMSDGAGFVFDFEFARTLFERISGRSYNRLIVRLKREVDSSEALELLLRERLTPEIRKRILNDAKEPLFRNYQGTMIGHGILWIVPGGNASGGGYSIVINYK